MANTAQEGILPQIILRDPACWKPYHFVRLYGFWVKYSWLIVQHGLIAQTESKGALLKKMALIEYFVNPCVFATLS